MVVFNGTTKQSGSVASGNSLVEDYTKLAQETLQIGEGNSHLSGQTKQSTASWHIHGVNVPENGELISTIWVVEKMGYFEEGGNKEEYYPDIVREIIYLDNAMNGSMTIDLPAPWDDDDLELHLIHQINLTVVEDPVPISVAPNEGAIPGFIGHFALFFSDCCDYISPKACITRATSSSVMCKCVTSRIESENPSISCSARDFTTSAAGFFV